MQIQTMVAFTRRSIPWLYNFITRSLSLLVYPWGFCRDYPFLFGICLSLRYSSNANHGEGPRALVEPMPQALSQVAVGHQPLSQELCDRVAEDLKRVTRQAIQLFHRVTLNMELPLSAKSTMTQTLASSVLQAQQHLSLAAPPPPMNPMTHAMLAQQQAMIGHQNHAHSTAQHSQPPLPQQQTPNVTLGEYNTQYTA